MQICTDDRCAKFAICVAVMEDVIIPLAIAELSLWRLHVNLCRTLKCYECYVIRHATIALFYSETAEHPRSCTRDAGELCATSLPQVRAFCVELQKA